MTVCRCFDVCSTWNVVMGGPKFPAYPTTGSEGFARSPAGELMRLAVKTGGLTGALTVNHKNMNDKFFILCRIVGTFSYPEHSLVIFGPCVALKSRRWTTRIESKHPSKGVLPAVK